MSRYVRLAAGLSLLVGAGVATVPQMHAAARAVPTINNLEQKVNGEGPRGEADQQHPDISSAGWAVWWDNRGSLTKQTGDSIWAKNLNTHTEMRVTTLTTATSFPRVDGSWAVWEDVVAGKREVLAKQLPSGSVIGVTDGSSPGQGFPAIDGTQVVWESSNTQAGNVDIYMRDIAGGVLGPVRLVTDDPGNQADPEISGNTVVWTDHSGASPRVMGRVMSATPGAEFVIADPPSGAHDPAISGDRVVWTQGATDTEGDSVMTCTLAASGCADPATPVWTTHAPNGDPMSPQADPEISGSRVVWLQNYSNNGASGVWYRDLSAPASTLPTLINGPSGGANGAGPGAERDESPKIDGTKIAWTASGFRGPDIYWKDLANTALPQRVNSLGLGRFPDQTFVSAGSTYVTYLADSGDFNPRNAVWATDLTGDRRLIRVSTFADFGTAISPPKISGNQIAWSDNRDGLGGPGDQGMLTATNVFVRDLPNGDETRVTTAGNGNHPWSSGDRIAWLCPESNLCVERAGSITEIKLPVADGYTADQQVRVSGNVGLWSEFQIDWTDQGPNVIDSKIHAVDLTTGEDEVLGSGESKPSFIPAYAMDGANVAWAGQNGNGDAVVYRNTVSFPCGDSCDRSASANLLSDNTSSMIRMISMDGNRVAWTENDPDTWGANVWLKDVTAPTSTSPTQVTTGGTAAGDLWLTGDFVYWSDGRTKPGFCDATTTGCDTDIYREYVGSGTPPPPLPADTTAPGVVSKFTATTFGNSIRVSWANPTTSDFVGTIVLRKTIPAKGKSALATGIDDPNATIVYDGPGTTFLDTDVAPGAATYTYTAFTYDEVPNYSIGVPTK